MGEQKIAGAAQRRSRGGLLQQGSIQNVALPQNFGDQFAQALCPSVVPCAIAADLVERAAQLSQSKYAAEHWLKRR
jgi:lipoate-protein ligase A